MAERAPPSLVLPHLSPSPSPSSPPQLPPPPGANRSPTSTSTSTSTSTALVLPTHPPPFFEAGTYVVQVPKDQVYRVPPPENAIIAERYRTPVRARKTRSSRCSPLLCCLVITAILVVATLVSVAVSYFVLKPKNPGFQLQRLAVDNRTSSLEYDLSFAVSNRNKASGVTYKSHGATSALSFRGHRLASGKFPSLHQGKGDTTSGVSVVLKGDDRSLPKEVEKGLRAGSGAHARLPLRLVMNVPVTMKTSSFKTGDAVLVVTCDFDVDKLAKGTRILSQDCNTER